MVSRQGTYLSDDSVRSLCPEALPVPMGQVYKMVKTQNVNAQRLSRRPENAGIMLRTMSRKFGIPLDNLQQQYVGSLYAIKNQGVISSGAYPLDTERRRQGRQFRQPVGVGGHSTGSIDREVLAESLAQADVDVSQQERRAMAAEYRQMWAQAQSRLLNMTKVERVEEFRRVSAGDFRTIAIAAFRRLSEGTFTGRDPQVEFLIQYELNRGWNPVRGNPLQTGQMMPPEAGTLGTAEIEEIDFAHQVEPVQQNPVEVGSSSASAASAATTALYGEGRPRGIPPPPSSTPPRVRTQYDDIDYSNPEAEDDDGDVV